PDLLRRCSYCAVYRMLVNTERCRKLVGYQADSTSFRVLLCIGGCGSMVWQDNGTLNFFKGDCVFVPAESVKFRIHGKAEFLDIRG
ncbi:MAG: class I mannose-6-phosphate isomerase, partial [Lachnospiraceae bacterium]